MDSEEKLASEERERAFNRFKKVLSVHGATIDAFGVLSTIPELSSAISANVRTRLGNPENSADEFDETARRVLDVVAEERSRSYAIVRSSTLIAVCGAFEYLVKAAFVHNATLNRSEAAALLTNAKVRLAAADVLGASSSETWFAIADRLFEQLAEPHQGMHQRLQRYLLGHTYLHFPGEKNNLAEQLGDVDVEAFNEAFLVRNCMVHKGGRVSSQLARMNKKLQLGEEVVLDKPNMQRLIKPIRELAKLLRWPYLGPV